MPWKFSNDVNEFTDAAWPVLSAEPERNTIGLTVVDNAKQRTEPREHPELYGWWIDGRGDVASCVSLTAPWPLLFSTVSEQSLPPLAEALRENGIQPGGVNAPTHAAATFGAIWHATTGQTVVMSGAMRLFGLTELTTPARTPIGKPRRATDQDVPLIVDWYVAFGNEVRHPMVDVESDVRLRLKTGVMWLWCVGDGAAEEPVSLAACSSTVEGVARIGPVYTPPLHRRRGYAEALTYVASEDFQRRGVRVVLFTDQANPTSNAIYQRLGYRAITDRMTLSFEGG